MAASSPTRSEPTTHSRYPRSRTAPSCTSNLRDASNPDPALVRMLNAGSRTYPFHPHGNHDKLIGIDGRPLRSIDGTLDLTRDEFSRVMVPGQTSEVLVTWVDAQGFSTNDIGVPVPPLTRPGERRLLERQPIPRAEGRTKGERAAAQRMR